MSKSEARASSTDRLCIGVDGKDGKGEQMTPQQIKTALKIH